eukprot:9150246-Pyramimonas_sp.AAC.1
MCFWKESRETPEYMRAYPVGVNECAIPTSAHPVCGTKPRAYKPQVGKHPRAYKRYMTSFYGSSCANNGKGALNILEPTRDI